MYICEQKRLTGKSVQKCRVAEAFAAWHWEEHQNLIYMLAHYIDVLMHAG